MNLHLAIAGAAMAFLGCACSTTSDQSRDPLDSAEWKTTKSRMYQDLALQCLQAEDHERALRLLQQAAQFDARDTRSVELLARLAYSRGDLATASGAARRLLATDPKSIAGLCTLGAVNEAQDRPEDAERFYRDAAAVGGTDPRPFVDLHRLLLATGRDAEAAALRTDVAARFPKAIEPALDHGAHLAARLEWHDAAAAYDRALAVQPTDAAATAGFALSTVMSGEPARALALGQGLPPHVRKNNPSLLLALAAAHLATGDHTAALHEIELGNPALQDRAPACLLRGEILWRLQRLDAARSCFERAIELEPRSAHAHASLGRLHLQQHNWHVAARVLERAVALEPANGSSRALLVGALAAAGDLDGAREHLAIARGLAGTTELLAQLERLHPKLRAEERSR